MINFKNIFTQVLRNPGAAIPFLFSLPKHIRLISRLMADNRVLLLPKVLFIASLVYLISPIDLVPDFVFPILGWADDLVIVFSAARYLLRAAPEEVLHEHVEAIQRG
jgi:uncharacterized membrane protein YkvA (DUF1232 family)